MMCSHLFEARYSSIHGCVYLAGGIIAAYSLRTSAHDTMQKVPGERGLLFNSTNNIVVKRRSKKLIIKDYLNKKMV